MKYSAKQFRKDFPDWKKEQCGVVGLTFHRPLSFIFASIFCNLKISPNVVSFIAWLWAFFSCLCFVMPYDYMYIIGALAVNFWVVLDCTDGNMARMVGGHPYGDFIDGASGYVMDGFLVMSMSFAVYRQGGLIIPRASLYILFIGAFSSMCYIMSKLYYHKAMDIEHLSGGKLNAIIGSGKKGSGRITY